MTIHWRDLDTASKIDTIKAVYQPGFTIVKIADAIGTVTKGAISGMFHRYRSELEECPLGTPAKNKPRKQKVRKSDKFSFGSMRSSDGKTIVVRRPGIEPRTCGRPLAVLSARECRWPVNDAAIGELHLFCGSEASGAYCEHHQLRGRTLREAR